MYRAKGSAFPLHVHLERFLRTNSHAFRDEKRHTECHLCFSGTRRDRSPVSHTLVVFEVDQVSKRLLYTWVILRRKPRKQVIAAMGGGIAHDPCLFSYTRLRRTETPLQYKEGLYM